MEVEYYVFVGSLIKKFVLNIGRNLNLYRLDIENFWVARLDNIIFGEHPVFIGANNTGKTTVIEALTLLLGRDKLIREWTEFRHIFCEKQYMRS